MGGHGNAFLSFGNTAVVGGWKELGRTTLGGANANINVSSLADKRYLMVLYSLDYTASLIPRRRFNADTGTNYADRISTNGGADATDVSVTGVITSETSTTPSFVVEYIANYSTKEKLAIMHIIYQNTAGAGTAPNRYENYSKWANTTDPLSAINNYTSTSTFKSGSECVVLGWDPADSHTDNFWTEVGSTTTSGTSTNIQTSITSKKYLWVQAYLPKSGSLQSYLRVNNVSTGTVYANRNSINSGADVTNVSANQILVSNSAETTPTFVNLFILNISANEKLVYGWSVTQNTAGAGTAPNRLQFCGKWITASAITEIDFVPSTSSFATGAEVRVWGSD